jgi:hypothetical protein
VVRLAIFCASLTLISCTAFEKRTQRTTLSDSGFLARVPETEKQRETYAALPPHELYRGARNGRAFYVYKDEKAGVVYIGNEQDFQRYMERIRALVSYFETTEEKMAPRDMNSELLGQWYGAWGDTGGAESVSHEVKEKENNPSNPREQRDEVPRFDRSAFGEAWH